MTKWKHSRLVLGIVIGCWALYTVLALFAPSATNARFKLGATNMFLLRLSIIVPLFFIWTTAARGASNFKQYAYLVSDGGEGKAIRDIANGLMWSLAYLIALSLS